MMIATQALSLATPLLLGAVPGTDALLLGTNALGMRFAREFRSPLTSEGRGLSLVILGTVPSKRSQLGTGQTLSTPLSYDALSLPSLALSLLRTIEKTETIRRRETQTHIRCITNLLGTLGTAVRQSFDTNTQHTQPNRLTTRVLSGKTSRAVRRGAIKTTYNDRPAAKSAPVLRATARPSLAYAPHQTRPAPLSPRKEPGRD